VKIGGVWILVALLIGVAFMVGRSSAPRPPQLPPPPAVVVYRDVPYTVYVRELELVFTEGADKLMPPIRYEVTTTDTVLLGWTLPWTWGVDRLRAPVSPGDSLVVSMYGFKVDSLTGIARALRMEKIWAPGYLKGLAVEDGELVVSYEEFPGPPSSTWRWVERGAILVGGFLLGRQ
jgi:hypothetical protein